MQEPLILKSKLKQTKKYLKRHIRIRKILNVMLFGTVGGFLILLISKLTEIKFAKEISLYLILLSFLGAVILALFKKVTLAQAGIYIDKSCGLEERVTSCYEFCIDKRDTSTVSGLLYKDAEEKSKSVNPKKICPFEYKLRDLFLGTVVILLAFLFIIPPEKSEATKNQEDFIKKLQAQIKGLKATIVNIKALGSPASKRLARKFESLLKAIKEGKDPKELLKKIKVVMLSAKKEKEKLNKLLEEELKKAKLDPKHLTKEIKDFIKDLQDKISRYNDAMIGLKALHYRLAERIGKKPYPQKPDLKPKKPKDNDKEPPLPIKPKFTRGELEETPIRPQKQIPRKYLELIKKYLSR